MRKWLIVSLVILFTLGMIGCQQAEGDGNNPPESREEQNNEETNKEENNQEQKNENKTNKETNETNKETGNLNSEDHETTTSEGLTNEQLGEILLTALKEKDLQTIASHTHPEKGLLITPYVYIEENIDSFSKEEVAVLLEDDRVYTWGIYDRKGTPIELTARQYFDEFIDAEIFNSNTEVFINDLQTRGNAINNIEEFFEPELRIEYYYEGSEEYPGMDWESLIFVFEKSKDNLYLVAIVGDRWTI